MTYKDVLDDLTDLLSRHYMIQTWGYGELSDLVAPFKRLDATDYNGDTKVIYNVDYPYAFLNPTAHQLAQGKSTFNFNLIVMEQCEEEPEAIIQAQSNCYQYIKDILAELYYNYDQKYDFTLNSSVIPFKEKYNDVVSGMTAAISIEIPTILNDCIAPFAPKYDDIYLDVAEDQPQTIGSDAGEIQEVKATTYYLNPDNQWNGYEFIANATRSYRITLNAYVRPVVGTGSQLPRVLALKQNRAGLDQYTSPTEQRGWPTDATQTDWSRLELTWNDIELQDTDISQVIASFDYPGAETDIELKQVEIKYYIK